MPLIKRTKLENIPAWRLDYMKPKAKAKAKALKEGKTVHFAHLMDLCNIKGSELPKNQWKYKGRIVLRGDTVTDESNFYGVFSEQGASASHLAAAKFSDAIARFPGNSGEDADAIGAYHQVK